MTGFEFVNEQNRPESGANQINYALLTRYNQQKSLFVKFWIIVFALFSFAICCICLIATAHLIPISNWNYNYKVALFALLLSAILIPFLVLYLRMFLILARIQDILLEWLDQVQLYEKQINQKQVAKLKKLINYSIYFAITFISLLIFATIYKCLKSIIKKA